MASTHRDSSLKLKVIGLILAAAVAAVIAVAVAYFNLLWTK
jgi:hypothetical protein